MKFYLILILFLSNLCHAYDNLKVSWVDRVYDGDTITVTILDLPALFGKKIGIRLNGIDTPELKGRGVTDLEKQAAQAVKEYVTCKIKNATSISLQNPQRGKYFRIVADVIVDETNISALLIENQYAKPYFGKTKEPWTETELYYIINDWQTNPICLLDKTDTTTDTIWCAADL